MNVLPKPGVGHNAFVCVSLYRKIHPFRFIGAQVLIKTATVFPVKLIIMVVFYNEIQNKSIIGKESNLIKSRTVHSHFIQNDN